VAWPGGGFVSNQQLKSLWHAAAALQLDFGTNIRYAPHDAVDAGFAEIENYLAPEKSPAPQVRASALCHGKKLLIRKPAVKRPRGYYGLNFGWDFYPYLTVRYLHPGNSIQTAARRRYRSVSAGV